MKQCGRCCLTKPLGEFGKQKDRDCRIGWRYRYRCKACDAEVRRLRYAADPEAELSKTRAKMAANREAYRQRRREYGKRNRGVINAQSAQKKAARSQRTPPWADKALIRDIYKYATIMRAAGVDCHVDHIAPLRGRLVSGLHVHTNLTVLLAEDNLAKHAKFSAA